MNGLTPELKQALRTVEEWDFMAMHRAFENAIYFKDGGWFDDGTFAERQEQALRAARLLGHAWKFGNYDWKADA
jgi:hypothetical protein